jgi:hypothetical protein
MPCRHCGRDVHLQLEDRFDCQTRQIAGLQMTIALTHAEFDKAGYSRFDSSAPSCRDEGREVPLWERAMIACRNNPKPACCYGPGRACSVHHGVTPEDLR